MAATRVFALTCWLAWTGLLVAGLARALPWPPAAAMAASVYVLWRIGRRALSARLR